MLYRTHQHHTSQFKKKDISLSVLLQSNSEPHSAVSQAHKAVVRALLDGGIVPSPATRTSIVEIARSRGKCYHGYRE